jgi:co-chaperonin GroES (HSP10)
MKKSNNKNLAEMAEEALSPTLNAPVPRPADQKRVIRKVSPLGMRVLVRVRADSNMSEGGLYLPEGAKQALSESIVAEVLEVASAVDDQSEEETNISGVPQGAFVLIAKNAGTKVPWDDSLRIVDTKEVLAIINEISLS